MHLKRLTEFKSGALVWYFDRSAMTRPVQQGLLMLGGSTSTVGAKWDVDMLTAVGTTITLYNCVPDDFVMVPNILRCTAELKPMEAM